MSAVAVRTIRVWAAERTEAGVVCLIRDSVAERWDLGLDDPDRIRWWAVVVAEIGEDPNVISERRHAAACGPGQPCGWCTKQARKWWVTWAEREAARAAKAEVGS